MANEISPMSAALNKRSADMSQAIADRGTAMDQSMYGAGAPPRQEINWGEGAQAGGFAPSQPQMVAPGQAASALMAPPPGQPTYEQNKLWSAVQASNPEAGRLQNTEGQSFEQQRMAAARARSDAEYAARNAPKNQLSGFSVT